MRPDHRRGVKEGIKFVNSDLVNCKTVAYNQGYILSFFFQTKSGLLPNCFRTDNSKAVMLLQFFFVCASVVSYVAFVLCLFVPGLTFVPRECCTP